MHAKDDLGLDHGPNSWGSPILAWMTSPHDPDPHELTWAAAAFLAKLAADQRRRAERGTTVAFSGKRIDGVLEAKAA